MNAIIASAFLGVLMMFASWIFDNEQTHTRIALAGLLALIVANVLQLNGIYTIPVDYKGMLSFTQFGLYVNTILFILTFLYVWLNGDEIAKIGNHAADFYALFFFILCGASILTSFNNLLMFFLMGAFSTGIFLLGITFIYGATGTFQLIAPSVNPATGMVREQLMQSAGLILIFVSFNFKVSATPFHFWTPDVYDGAPTVFTSFMATIVKATAIIAFVVLFHSQFKALGYAWELLLTFVLISTLFVGNITAVFQRSVKRMLAYSSIAQVGFMLFALYGPTNFANEGILLYIMSYSIASIGLFGVLIKMKDYSFEAFNGLAKKEPLLAGMTTLFLLSLAGIPLTGGFFAKYYMLNAAVQSGVGLWLVVVAILFAAISIYYYFKLIQAMYFAEGEPAITEMGQSYKYKLLVFAILILGLGILPNVFLSYLYF